MCAPSSVPGVGAVLDVSRNCTMAATVAPRISEYATSIARGCRPIVSNATDQVLIAVAASPYCLMRIRNGDAGIATPSADLAFQSSTGELYEPLRNAREANFPASDAKIG